MLDEIDRLYEKRKSSGGLSNVDCQGTVEAINTSFSVLIEDVRSLFNVGSILRTADGVGADMLYLCGVTGCPPRKEIAKASLGAEETVAWQFHRGSVSILRRLKEKGVQIVGLESADSSILLKEALAGQLLRTPVCLALGNEVMGLSAETIALCDILCKLPMRGRKESLNVAVAFGIASYSIVESLG
jgi:tRNA G18 (ribose-2'-O)-methylase SpoU